MKPNYSTLRGARSWLSSLCYLLWEGRGDYRGDHCLLLVCNVLSRLLCLQVVVSDFSVTLLRASPRFAFRPLLCLILLSCDVLVARTSHCVQQ